MRNGRKRSSSSATLATDRLTLRHLSTERHRTSAETLALAVFIGGKLGKN
jgi:hypothetical protein